MKSFSVAAVLTIALSFVTLAVAHAPPIPNCKDVQSLPDESMLTIESYHVGDGPSVWQESNGFAGLQMHEHSCRVKHDADGRPILCGGTNQPPCEIRTFAADTPL